MRNDDYICIHALKNIHSRKLMTSPSATECRLEKQKHITLKRLNSPYLFRTMPRILADVAVQSEARKLFLPKCGIRELKPKNFELVMYRRLYMYVYDRKKSFRRKKTRRYGSTYLGVVELCISEVCYANEGYLGSAVVLHI